MFTKELTTFLSSFINHTVFFNGCCFILFSSDDWRSEVKGGSIMLNRFTHILKCEIPSYFSPFVNAFRNNILSHKIKRYADIARQKLQPYV